MNGAPLLSLRGLSVEFRGDGTSNQVLDGVSLHVRRGERVGIVGESGCGKSLTVQALMGLLPQSARVTGGEVDFGGTLLPRRAWGHAPRPPAGMAMIFQQPTAALNPVFTVGDQMLAVARTLGGRAPRSALFERCARVLEQVQLGDSRRVMASYPFQLSGGMRQRVLIALALLRRPRLLIADEPGTALDVTIQAEILALLDELVREEELALLHITHNLGVARETTDRIYVMYAGNVVEHATTRDLFRDPTHPYTIGLLESIPRLDGGGIGVGIPGTVPGADHLPRGCRFRGRCPLADDACKELRPPAYADDAHRAACVHPVTTQGRRETLWT